MENKKEFNHAVIGILESGEILTLEYVFEKGEFKGAVGHSFRYVSQAEIDEMNTTEYAIEMYESGTGETWTEEEAESYMQYEMDGDFPFHDNSYSAYNQSRFT